MTGELERFAGDVDVTVTPLKSGGRRDVHVGAPPAVESFGDIVDRLRQFFDRVDQEAEANAGDPFYGATTLARLDALLADVRAVRDNVRDATAHALDEQRIRRLSIDHVGTVEASSTIKRSQWDDAALLRDALHSKVDRLVDTSTGETYGPERLAAMFLEFARPSWRMTALRDAGLNPDDYCDVAVDDDGRPIRTATVSIRTNEIRRNR